MKNKTHRIIDAALCAIFFAIIVCFGLWVCIKAPDTLSVSERRELSSKPEVSQKSILSGEYFEKLDAYLPDQFPKRDGFKRLKAFIDYYLFRRGDNHGITIENGSAVSIYTPSRHSTDVFIKRINTLYERHFSALSGSHLYVTLIPDKMYFVKDSVGYPTMDYEGLKNRLASDETAGEYIDISALLSIDDYYSTDSHWRQECIVNVADRLLCEMDAEQNGKLSLSEPLENFYGVYYGQSSLPLAPDSIVCVHSDVIDSAVVYRADMYSRELVKAKMYYPELISSDEPYDIYLGGACTVTVIENAASKNGKTLYLFSDSYGRSLAPLLVAGYEKIIVCDIRYINPGDIKRLVPECENADVLLAYSIATVDISSELRVD